MKTLILMAVLTLTGCASFNTTQTDMTYEKGQPLRQITTQAKSRTFFDSRSSLASFKATQTDKSQTASVGSLNQDASGTNAVDLVTKITGAVVNAAIKAAAP